MELAESSSSQVVQIAQSVGVVAALREHLKGTEHLAFIHPVLVLDMVLSCMCIGVLMDCQRIVAG